ncbi:MAG TPA: hypothetical protein VFS31_09865 [Chitinophagaceae bacterium]|nr:hypothetical protein [Chitinophagaceae bacterium]
MILAGLIALLTAGSQAQVISPNTPQPAGNSMTTVQAKLPAQLGYAWYINEARKRWPQLPANTPGTVQSNNSQLPAGQPAGQYLHDWLQRYHEKMVAMRNQSPPQAGQPALPANQPALWYRQIIRQKIAEATRKRLGH